MLDDAAPTLVVAERDPAALLSVLFRQGVRHVLLEGGPTLAGAFLQAGMIDRVVGYLAPLLLGSGPAALGDAGIATLADAVRLTIDEVRQLGPDLRVSARPVREA